MVPEPDRLTPRPKPNRIAALALLPMAATFGYYVLPISLRDQPLIPFIPQCLSYLALVLWTTRADQITTQLGLDTEKRWDGLRWGMVTGIVLGVLNTFVILAVCPSLGYDITFLKQTPHGRLPVFLMVPWVICTIALFVELNFRGFLLGRLVELEWHWRGKSPDGWMAPLALAGSAVTFAFDPFLVNTFRDLHWIALWDGVIWGMIWLRTRNLWITIVAHAVEVLVMYSAVRAAIG